LEGLCTDCIRFWVDVGSGLGFLFKIFYEKVRVKLACRNPKKIPHERLYELDRKLFLISIVVEGFEDSSEDNLGGDSDGDGLGGDEGGTNEDEDDDLLDDEPEQMETDERSKPRASTKTPM
jgi:hypothetical protein